MDLSRYVAIGVSLGEIRPGFLHRQLIILLLQRISGRQELLERCLVQNWLVLRVGTLAGHGGGDSEPMMEALYCGAAPANKRYCNGRFQAGGTVPHQSYRERTWENGPRAP